MSMAGLRFPALCAVVLQSGALGATPPASACRAGSAAACAAGVAPSLVQVRRTVAKEATVKNEQCVHETDCDTSPWCTETSLEDWCLQHVAPWSECPTPHCRLEAVGDPVRTPDDGDAGPSPAPPPGPSPPPAPAPTTPAPAVETTSAPAPTPPPSTGACIRQEDCSISAWCADTGFDAWCGNEGNGCVEPYCTRAGGASPTPATSSAPVQTSAPTQPPTTAPTSKPTAPPTAAPTSAPTAAPTSAPTSAPTAAPTSAPTPPTGQGVGQWFTQADFDAFFPNINTSPCTGQGFFTYDALIQAASAYPTFANSGNADVDRLELAAFLGQTSHETTGGWATAPGGPQAWGYCWKAEVGCESGTCTQYCAGGNPCTGFDCTCVPGKTYQGRGPIQLSWNYNYGQASKALFNDPSKLLANPELVANNATVAYMTGLWFWMTPQNPKPSCHDVMAGLWTPSAQDQAGGRTAGYGMTTNIINGGLECNMPTNSKVTDRVEFYKRYAQLLGVQVDESTLYCDTMQNYR